MKKLLLIFVYFFSGFLFAQDYYTVENTVNIRSGPSIHSLVLGQFNKNTTIMVNGFVGNWAVVQYSSFHNVYVHKNYITYDRIKNLQKIFDTPTAPVTRTFRSTPSSRSVDVSGYDENGDYFYGIIDISDNGGEGYLEGDDGVERYIYLDWSGQGILDGYDDDGTYYEMEIE
tara:strand:- start:31 stop:546 length:516 start_codon:yes stop_codon:yes gene_type:complete